MEYGSDACHLCEMTIVDKQHSAQIVSCKGKAYKYDSIECMIRSTQKSMKDTDISLYLVADFSKPGELVNAKNATYLISENILSPMGANLSAFSSSGDAKDTQEEFSGKLYSWDEIQAHFRK